MKDEPVFCYMYSAPLNKEVQAIKNKYLPRAEASLKN